MSAAADPIEQWRAAWPQALALWSRYTRLHDPLLCVHKVDAARAGLQGSFAMIRLSDQSVVIDLETVARLQLHDYAVEILAHEIGHHVLAPGSVTDHFRLIARIRRALPTLERHAPMVANLYTDLHINDRLQRQSGMRMADIYQRLNQADGKGAPGSRVWDVYMRMYEHLWKLDPGTLTPVRQRQKSDNTEADAWLGARLIRVYANEWMFAGSRFAALLLPYLVDGKSLGPATLLHDTGSAAQDCDPGGVLAVEEDELAAGVHPSEDPLVNGAGENARDAVVPDNSSGRSLEGNAGGQAREPFEYGEILRASGIKMSEHDIAVRYYRERALPYLVPFPTKVKPATPEPQMEGLEPWNMGAPLDDIDWLQTLLVSPRPIPGVTTVQRTYGHEEGRVQRDQPIDLDLYVDSSGSMPNPQVSTSYPALAGAIIALSALRTGARVQVTLWSGKNQVAHTKGFVSDEHLILRVLTEFFGGGTTFPIHRLRETAALERTRGYHILMVSDAGITTMFDDDEQGNSGWDVAADALKAGGAGGSMALQIEQEWAASEGWAANYYAPLKRARAEQGWDIHAITTPEELLAFARDFSRRHYIRTRKR